MPISFGANSITGISVGNQSIAEAYVGSTKIWPEEPAYNHDWVWADEANIGDGGTGPGTVLNDVTGYIYFNDNPNRNTAVLGYISNGYSNGDVDITVLYAEPNTEGDYHDFYNAETLPASVVNTVWGRYIVGFVTNEAISAGQVIRIPSVNARVVPVNYMPGSGFALHNVLNGDTNQLSYWLALGSIRSTVDPANFQFYMTNGIQAYKGNFLGQAYNKINTGGYKLDFNAPGSLLTTARELNWWTPAFGIQDTFQNWGTVASSIKVDPGYVHVGPATATVYSHVDQGEFMIFPWRQNQQENRLRPTGVAKVSGTSVNIPQTLTNQNALTSGVWWALYFSCGHNIDGFYEPVPMDWSTSTISTYPVGVSSFVNIEP